MYKFNIIFLMILCAASAVIYCGEGKPEVRAYGMLSNGVQEPVAKLIVEEFQTKKHFSLLNYVFFEEGSAVISNRYQLLSKDETMRFNPEEQFLNYQILDVYYNLLNIVGFRLNKFPEEKIFLTGCNSNTGAEKGNMELSLERANAIKKYLTEIWGIEPHRIEILRERNLPENPSQSQVEPNLSDEENRRVEIQGSWNILSPLLINDIQRYTNPPSIIFITKSGIQSKIKEWKLPIEQENRRLETKVGVNSPQEKIIWHINKNKKQIPTTEKPLVYWLECIADLLASSKKEKLSVEQINILKKRTFRMESKTYSRYNLILFNFNSKELNDYNKNIINLIKTENEINDSSKIFVTGYTDNIGIAETNLKISTGRAAETSNEILKYGINSNQITVAGVGSTTSPYFNSAIDKLIVANGMYIEPDFEDSIKSKADESSINYNKTPEGRFYCRTVVIEIENKIKYENE